MLPIDLARRKKKQEKKYTNNQTKGFQCSLSILLINAPSYFHFTVSHSNLLYYKWNVQYFLSFLAKFGGLLFGKKMTFCSYTYFWRNRLTLRQVKHSAQRACPLLQVVFPVLNYLHKALAVCWCEGMNHWLHFLAKQTGVAITVSPGIKKLQGFLKIKLFVLVCFEGQ